MKARRAVQALMAYQVLSQRSSMVAGQSETAASSTSTAPRYSTDGTVLDYLQEMKYDLGYGEETFEAYVQPNITTMSQGTHDQEQTMDHNGHAVKFFNMSPQTVVLYWDGGRGREVNMGRCQPFGVSGTASFPGHQFFFALEDYVKGGSKLVRFHIDQDGLMSTNYYYDPFTVEGDDQATEENLMRITYDDLEQYNIMKRNKQFNEHYKKVTGRNYLSMYPRQKSKYFMWPADYFGQEHWFTSRETHFETIPPPEDIEKIVKKGKARVLKEDEPRLLSQHRTNEPYLNLTFTVLSCAPRVYEIPNFLSDSEVDHILNIAHGANLLPSSTGSHSEGSGSEKETKTRTSLNTWVGRETDQVIDSVYRRAADFLRIDESLFRPRDEDEFPNLPSKSSIAEHLQLVHYNVGQEYTAHHDFGYADAKDKIQGSRFATLLLYLNEPEEGGETEFPRWFNGETGQGLAAKPKKGKAVLFYSQLPDGNMDDLSHHAALPVTQGEKYLINLWVRDPIFER
jgi:prolyl 4-hydroxylase